MYYPVQFAESNSTGATYHSPETNDNAPEEITAQPASPPLNRRTSSRLSTRVTDAPNSSTASSEPPTTRSTGTTLRRGRLARKAPPRRKLAELSAVEVQRVTTRNTQFNEKYNQCPLELVVIHRDIPRPVSPTLDPIVEAEASEDDNSNGEKEHDPVSANSELLEMPTLSLEEPSTALLDRSLDNVSLDDTDGDSTGGSSRRIRWDPKLVTLETTHPTGHMEPSLPVTSQFKPCLKCSTSAPIRLFPESPPPPLTAEERWGINLTNGSSTPPTDSTVDESDSLPTSSGRSNLASRIGRPGQDPQASSLSPPSTVIQRLLYVDDDLDDPELQEQLVYRNRVYRRALRATRDLVATGESPMDVDPEALEDITRDLLGKGKAKSTKRRKKSR
ncbi:hypothetical protein IWQ62_004402 [Dispira parvispora]|uniref:Uncharacterized protein n=1 Tax=Dispira parvispora TaxID=1520584 RepID=A0A9W8E0P9_9FUNG|nr:hypothetical protein IWQ62_004402 [Dispira parvispora]